jgi:hypothetical protein
MSETRIEKLERLIPKFKANKKISTLKIEAMEWELRALKAELNNKILIGLLERVDELGVSNSSFQDKTLENEIKMVINA